LAALHAVRWVSSPKFSTEIPSFRFGFKGAFLLKINAIARPHLGFFGLWKHSRSQSPSDTLTACHGLYKHYHGLYKHSHGLYKHSHGISHTDTPYTSTLNLTSTFWSGSKHDPDWQKVADPSGSGSATLLRHQGQTCYIITHFLCRILHI